MADQELSRRQFVQSSAVAAAALAMGIGGAGVQKALAEELAEIKKTRSYNPEMEYKRLGKTGAWVSAVCMGGHWKRIDTMINGKNTSGYNLPAGEEKGRFQENRTEIVSRCIERGINLVDACTAGEIQAYAKALKGRREAMFLNFSWYEGEMRNAKCRTAPALLKTLENGLKTAELEYADLWRITCLEKGGQHTTGEVEEMIKALDTARKQGKCRFTGLSSHDRPWLKMLIETYPETIQVVVSPYTANSKVLPEDSLFEAVKKHNVGFLGIKPFASNSLFEGDSTLNHAKAADDDKKARMAIRYILTNPAITAPIPGLINIHQVDNVADAIKERRQLDVAEKAELEKAGQEMWARLPEDYQWLKEWEYV